MNLDLLKTTKKSENKSETIETFPSIPVITLLSEKSGKKKVTKTLQFNVKALNTLGIGEIGKEDHTRIIVFDNYLISDPGEVDRLDLVMFTTNEKVIKADKQYHSYGISLGTGRSITNEIYDMIAKRFHLDTKIDNYIQLVPTHARTGGAFAFQLMENNKYVELNTPENVFDKGESVEIEMKQY